MTSNHASNGVHYVHRLTRQGQQTDGTWVTRLAPRVTAWASAVPEEPLPLLPHTDASYDAYLRWYQARTRSRITYPAEPAQPHEPTVTDTYPRHRDQYLAGLVS
jgi:hypothetical protein